MITGLLAVGIATVWFCNWHRRYADHVAGKHARPRRK